MPDLDLPAESSLFVPPTSSSPKLQHNLTIDYQSYKNSVQSHLHPRSLLAAVKMPRFNCKEHPSILKDAIIGKSSPFCSSISYLTDRLLANAFALYSREYPGVKREQYDVITSCKPNEKGEKWGAGVIVYVPTNGSPWKILKKSHLCFSISDAMFEVKCLLEHDLHKDMGEFEDAPSVTCSQTLN